MAKQIKDPRETSEFVRFVGNFDRYVRGVVSGTIERIEDLDDRAFAGSVGSAAVHIAENLHGECVKLYRNGAGDLRQRLDAATVRMGGNILTEGILKLMASPRATRGAWSKIQSIIEAIKKILQDILNVSIFGVSLSDVLGLGIDIDEILRVIDNLIRTIAEIFGGKAHADRMYEIELQNIRMTQELIRVKKLKLAF